MRNLDPLSAMSKAYQRALARDLIGQRIESSLGPPLILRPLEKDVEIIQFRQIWNSTALGFDMRGKPGMTAAYTTIVTDRKSYAVYFNGRKAYVLSKPNQKFFEDLDRRVLRPVKNLDYYQRIAIHAK